jgi:hypothetical protein
VESEENSTQKTLRVSHYFPQPLLLALLRKKRKKKEPTGQDSSFLLTLT